MKLKTTLRVAAAFGAFAMASSANAATLLFELNTTPLFGSPQSAIFELDSNPTPDRINDQSAFGIEQIFFDNVSGIFNGIEGTANIGFGRGGVAKIQVLGPAGAMNRVNASAGGPNALFTGSLQAPVFAPGSPTLTRGTLTITEVGAAVPEPATWAMMLIGFGAIGFAMRRRKQNVKVRYAF